MSEPEEVVFSSPWLPEAHLVQSMLTAEGVPARVRNALLSGLAGEIPFDAARVEVLVPVSRFAEAEALVTAAREAPPGVSRPCSACGESNPPAFEICWSCAGELPPAPILRAVD